MKSQKYLKPLTAFNTYEEIRMKTVKYNIPNISCKHCTRTITMELSEIEGVKKVDPDLESKSVTVSYEDPATEQGLINTLKEINYPPA